MCWSAIPVSGVAASSRIPIFERMNVETFDEVGKGQVCECGHLASKHDEEEGECKVAGCPCEAMEPTLDSDDADGVDDDDSTS
jgi:hypothetical protein